jgi:hypothetical protein
MVVGKTFSSSLKSTESIQSGHQSAVPVRAKKLLDSKDPGDAQEFAVVLAKFDDHPLAEAIIGPFRGRIRGINYCTFYLGGYVAHIKTDRRNIPRKLSDFVLEPGTPLRILLRDLSQSQEFSRMHKIVTAPGIGLACRASVADWNLGEC